MSLADHIGSSCFFKCPRRSWIPGTIAEWDSTAGATCKALPPESDLVSKLKSDDVYPVAEETLVEDTDDLLMLKDLHESTLLNCIRQRYFNDIIYTNIGSIVVALNPFKFTIPRYADSMMESYLDEGEIIQRCLPHSWACAHNTYFAMRNEDYNQSILISGESGSGKTEATKIVVKYLGALTARRGSVEQREAAAMVGSKINMSSPVLEAFGNAKTVRNDNSSRFGKFMIIRFDAGGFMVGAQITKYLLEKSRIITASRGERIYHAFYLLLHSKTQCDALGLTEAKEYHILNAGGTMANSEFDSEQEFNEVRTAMHSIGMDPSSVNSIWKVLAGILTLENVDFEADGEGSRLAGKSDEMVRKGCELWAIDRQRYEQELKETTLTIMGMPVKRLMSVAQAMDARSALNKALYDSVFSWLVDQCNNLLSSTAKGKWIGLLDIFGFEDFKCNSFEQLCINLTNETLQQHYNTYIFSKDVAECRSEGIDVSEVPFPDNTPCLQLISGRGGILALLDEECQLGSGTDAEFLAKVIEAHCENPFFELKKLSKMSFVIKHYAGDVTYDVQDFREKNLDTLKDAWRHICRDSTDPFVAALLDAPTEQKGSKPTVGGLFKRQLAELLVVINNTSPHWIRCIKPHPSRKPNMFDGPSVLNQLLSSGALGTVKIRKAGYAVRLPIQQFVSQFKCIAVCVGKPIDPQSILDACGFGKGQAQVGTRRVFFRSAAFHQLQLFRKNSQNSAAKVIQAAARGVRNSIAARSNLRMVHQPLINALREYAKRLIGVQEEEVVKRNDMYVTEDEAFQDMFTLEDENRLVIQEREAQRRARVEAAMHALHTVQQSDLMENEESFRATIVSECETSFENILSKAAMGYQIAAELAARREYQEAEMSLMRERRSLREARRQRDLQRIVSVSAERLEPTFKQIDRTLRAVQYQARVKEEADVAIMQRAEELEQRRSEAEQRLLERTKQQSEALKERKIKEWRTQKNIARSNVAFERWQRVQSEDFEWQRLEQQLLKAQKLAIEEQRRIFLREKETLEAQHRQKIQQEAETARERRHAQFAADEERKKRAEKQSSERKKLDEANILRATRDLREEQRLRQRAQSVQRSIAWENDRRERMLLQRPDISPEEVTRLRLSDRVPPPDPFVMVRGNVTFSKTWSPFDVVKLVASPSSGVALGKQFVVCWMVTYLAPRCEIVVRSSYGDIGRHTVTHAIGQAMFTAPNQWFSELEIEFLYESRVMKVTRLPKATSV